MIMKKLTALDGGSIYVQLAYITTMHRSLPDETTVIYLTGTEAPVFVKETPQEILA